MYTQCPECGVACRITVDILRQAAGQARCGGCGIAFNALVHLSEQRPGATVPSVSVPETQVPELKPEELGEPGEPGELGEPGEPGGLGADKPPQSVSAEQNAELLETLDQLAGSDIRIEDTGIEWRVLDNDEIADEALVDTTVSDDPPEVVDEMFFDDNSPLPVDFDVGSEPRLPIPESEPQPVIEAAETAPGPEDSQVDLAFGDPNEWEDLLTDLNETEADARGELSAETEEPAADEPLDVDTQFAIQAEAMGIDLSGLHEVVVEEAEEDGVEDDAKEIGAEFDDEIETVVDTIVSEMDSKGEGESDEFFDTADGSDECEVPEMTEEEKTINKMIDQELFNIAFEDEDGSTSAIVPVPPDEKIGGEIDEAPLIESIIMEDEFVRGEQDEDKLVADNSTQSHRFDDLGISNALQKATRGTLRRGQRETGPPGTGTIFGIIALLLVLILQVMHQSRESLATVPAFNQAVGPVYRMLGKPMTPKWDISGWRFEATMGNTERVGEVDGTGEAVENDEVLTIYSRVGNNSNKALPYPLVHLSLTDRYEEIIGSRVLEPGEYLAENADPRTLVSPGDTFNAVISIESPSEEATGFKLNVCYRLASGQLRCVIEDFR